MPSVTIGLLQGDESYREKPMGGNKSQLQTELHNTTMIKVVLILFRIGKPQFFDPKYIEILKEGIKWKIEKK